jgi:hypothetical protein
MRHPQVGMLELRREKLPIGDSGGQLLVIYHAEPGSGSARSLALLGSLAATDQAAAAGAGTAHEPRTLLAQIVPRTSLSLTRRS